MREKEHPSLVLPAKRDVSNVYNGLWNGLMEWIDGMD